MTTRTEIVTGFFALSLSAFLPALGIQDQPDIPPTSTPKNKVVYVCACLKTKSCPWMTEAQSAGPCACGAEGGPPIKAVPADGDRAKQSATRSPTDRKRALQANVPGRFNAWCSAA
jgi:hypothetical protein